MKPKFFSILGIALSLLCCITANAQLTPKEGNAADILARHIITDLNTDGLHGSISAAIIKNDKVIWANAFGYTSHNKDILADTNTMYRIGSITKTFTATLLLQLVAEGKVKLDDPVEKYVSEVKKLVGYDETDKMTLLQLASHTAGINREPDMKDANIGSVEHWEEKLLECIPHTAVYVPPGQSFKYSNMGFAILGLALERATGVPYVQMVQERIFEPLHMTGSYFVLPKDKFKRLAYGIDNDNDKVDTALPEDELKGRGYRVPNGGIFSSPTDLSKFVMSLMGMPPLLSDDSRKLMRTIPPGGKNYGLGLMTQGYRDSYRIGHGGSTPGYTSEYLIDLKSGYAVILMRSYNKGATSLEKEAATVLLNLK